MKYTTAPRPIAIFAVSTVIAVTASTHADLDGLLVVDKTDAKAASMGLFVCNIYARFTHPESILLSVGDANMITQDGSDFWQHDFGGETAPPGFLIPIFPDIIYDTFVTFGVKNTDEGPGGIDYTLVDAEYYNFGYQITGGWFVTSPPSGQGVAGAYDDLGMGDGNYYILIAQLTTISETAIVGVEGSMKLFWQHEYGAGGQTQATDVEFKHVPAPGAWMLLAIGAAAGGRAARRRRSC